MKKTSDAGRRCVAFSPRRGPVPGLWGIFGVGLCLSACAGDDAPAETGATGDGLPAGTGTQGGTTGEATGSDSVGGVSSTGGGGGATGGESATGTSETGSSGGNRSPVAFADVHAGLRAQAVALHLRAEDPDGDVLQFELLTTPEHGQLEGSPPDLIYRPAVDFVGQDFLTFQVSDGLASSEVARVDIDITEHNRGPEAIPQSLALDEDRFVELTLSGSDPDGDPLSFEVTRAPTHGELMGEAPELSYHPDPDFYGSDHIEFEVHDGFVSSAPARIDFEVAPVNDAPVADDLAVAIGRDAIQRFYVTAIDVDGDTLTLDIVREPEQGRLSIVDDEVPGALLLEYQPPVGYRGTQSFEFFATDGELDSEPGTVELRIGGTNEAPVVEDVEVQAEENTPVEFVISGRDPEGEGLSYRIVTHPRHGKVEILRHYNGESVRYTPEPGFQGDDALFFRAHDGELDSQVGEVQIRVGPAGNRPPEADDITVTSESGGRTTIRLTGSDPDGDELTFHILSEPKIGELSGEPPELSFTHSGATNGVTELSFVADDGSARSEPATVTIRLRPASSDGGGDGGGDDGGGDGGQTNVPPEILGLAAPLEVDEDGALSLGIGDFLIQDPDSTAFELILLPGPNYSLRAPRRGGYATNTVVPEGDFFGTLRVSAKVNDGFDDSANFEFDLKVNEVNDAPTGTDKAAAVDEGGMIAMLDLLAGADDPDPDDVAKLYAKIVSPPQFAKSFGITLPGALSYEHNGSETLSDALLFQICDARVAPQMELCSGNLRVDITINPINDPPSATNKATTGVVGNTAQFVRPAPRFLYSGAPTQPHTVFTGSLLTGASDPEGQALAVVAELAKPTNLGGQVDIAADGSFVYLPPVGVTEKTDSFSFSVIDKVRPGDGGTPQTGSATVMLAIGDHIVWYIDNDPSHAGATADGRSLTPYTKLSSLAPLPGRSRLAVSSLIYLHEGSSDYTGGLSLDMGEQLRGAGVALGNFGGLSIAATNPPVIRPDGRSGIGMAGGNEVRGVDIHAGEQVAVEVAGTDNELHDVGIVLSGSGSGIAVKGSTGAKALLFASGTLTTGTGSSSGFALSLDDVDGLVEVRPDIAVKSSAKAVISAKDAAGARLKVGKLGLEATAGTAIQLRSAMTMENSSAAGSSAKATGAAVLDIHDAKLDLNFDTLDATNPAADGLVLKDLSDHTSLKVATKTTITSAGNHGLALSELGASTVIELGACAISASAKGLLIGPNTVTSASVSAGVCQVSGAVAVEATGLAKLSFDSLEAVASAGAGLEASKIGLLEVDSTDKLNASIVATGGPALALESSKLDMHLDRVRSKNAPAKPGVLLNKIGADSQLEIRNETLVDGAGTRRRAGAEAIKVDDWGTGVDFRFGPTKILNRTTTGILLSNGTGGTVSFGRVEMANPGGASGNGLEVDTCAAKITVEDAEITATVRSKATRYNEGIALDHGDGVGIKLSGASGGFLIKKARMYDIADHAFDLRDSANVELRGLDLSPDTTPAPLWPYRVVSTTCNSVPASETASVANSAVHALRVDSLTILDGVFSHVGDDKESVPGDPANTTELADNAFHLREIDGTLRIVGNDIGPSVGYTYAGGSTKGRANSAIDLRNTDATLRLEVEASDNDIHHWDFQGLSLRHYTGEIDLDAGNSSATGPAACSLAADNGCNRFRCINGAAIIAGPTQGSLAGTKTDDLTVEGNEFAAVGVAFEAYADAGGKTLSVFSDNLVHQTTADAVRLSALSTQAYAFAPVAAGEHFARIENNQISDLAAALPGIGAGRAVVLHAHNGATAKAVVKGNDVKAVATKALFLADPDDTAGTRNLAGFLRVNASNAAKVDVGLDQNTGESLYDIRAPLVRLRTQGNVNEMNNRLCVHATGNDFDDLGGPSEDIQLRQSGNAPAIILENYQVTAGGHDLDVAQHFDGPAPTFGYDAAIIGINPVAGDCDLNGVPN